MNFEFVSISKMVLAKNNLVALMELNYSIIAPPADLILHQVGTDSRPITRLEKRKEVRV